MTILRFALTAALLLVAAFGALFSAQANESASSEPMYGPATYDRTAEAVSRYEDIAMRGGWRPVPTTAIGLKLGSVGPDVAALNARFLVSGDLAEGTPLSEVFDAETAAALKRFQLRHGLSDTGSVGRLTLKALNVPVEVRLNQLGSSLARLAGNGFVFTQRYVVVNIPAAAAEAVENGLVARRHVAVVGRPDRPSPVLEAKIGSINLNPTWTAPLSIVKADIVPKVAADPTFLAKSHMRVLGAGGQEIDPATIDWSGKSAVNYTIRQDPGPTNALGELRIDMPNVHAVYMHDTPKKDLFRSDLRFHSSGCARIQGVKDLAAWLLEGTGWDRLTLEAEASNGERKDIRLPKPVPVAWVYLTAWGRGDGQVQFRDDIYSLDTPQGITTSTLQARRPVPKIVAAPKPVAASGTRVASWADTQ
jgi:murein L,D-transpeptidase YcbB/YkuD